MPRGFNPRKSKQQSAAKILAEGMFDVMPAIKPGTFRIVTVNKSLYDMQNALHTSTVQSLGDLSEAAKSPSYASGENYIGYTIGDMLLILAASLSKKKPEGCVEADQTKDYIQLSEIVGVLTSIREKKNLTTAEKRSLQGFYRLFDHKFTELTTHVADILEHSDQSESDPKIQAQICFDLAVKTISNRVKKPAEEDNISEEATNFLRASEFSKLETEKRYLLIELFVEPIKHFIATGSLTEETPNRHDIIKLLVQAFTKKNIKFEGEMQRERDAINDYHISVIRKEKQLYQTAQQALERIMDTLDIPRKSEIGLGPD